jgi:hypothetical protein
MANKSKSHKKKCDRYKSESRLQKNKAHNIEKSKKEIERQILKVIQRVENTRKAGPAKLTKQYEKYKKLGLIKRSA